MERGKGKKLKTEEKERMKNQKRPCTNFHEDFE